MKTTGRLDILHKNVRQFGMISNTVADAVQLGGGDYGTSAPAIGT